MLCGYSRAKSGCSLIAAGEEGPDNGYMTYTAPQGPTGAPHLLRRSAHDRMLAGVAGGLAQYLNIDARMMRVGLVIGTMLTAGSAVPLLYVLAWLALPEEGKAMSVGSEWLRARGW